MTACASVSPQSGAPCTTTANAAAHHTAEHRGTHPERGSELRWDVTGDDLDAWATPAA